MRVDPVCCDDAGMHSVDMRNSCEQTGVFIFPYTTAWLGKATSKQQYSVLHVGPTLVIEHFPHSVNIHVI